jgi:hypothetical protein
MDSTVIQNAGSMLVDLLSGDESIFDRDDFSQLDPQQIRKALEFLMKHPDLNEEQKIALASNSWRINYRDKPPTPDNFITERYLGPVSQYTYDRVKKTFKEFMDPTKPYRNGILYPHIGWGKSYLSALVMIYIGVHLSMMRSPYKYFGLNPASVLTQLLVSYSLKKSSELLLEPLIAILENSPFFEKVHTREGMIKKDRDFTRQNHIDRIYWTTAVPTSAIQMSNGANMKTASNPTGLLGLAQPLDAKIQLPDNSYTTMGQLKVGDEIKSPTEGVQLVTGVFPQGSIDCYEIELDDGRKTRCSANHLWKVAWEKDESNNWIWRVVTTQFMINNSEIEFEIYS